jgi:hypothetical protein
LIADTLSLAANLARLVFEASRIPMTTRSPDRSPYLATRLSQVGCFIAPTAHFSLFPPALLPQKTASGPLPPAFATYCALLPHLLRNPNLIND